MKTPKSLIRLGILGLVTIAIAGTPVCSHAQDATGTNAVKTVKHKKKKMTDTNSVATVTPPVVAPVTPAAQIVKPTSPVVAKPDAATSQVGHNKSGVLPFHGKLKEVNVAAKTFTVGTRTFTVNSETIIIKDGKPASLSDGKVGDETGGAFKKDVAGELIVTKLRFGAKSDAEKPAAK